VRRGDLYRVPKPGGDDPKASRVFAVASRQAFVGSLSPSKLRDLDRALVAALGIDVENLFD